MGDRAFRGLLDWKIQKVSVLKYFRVNCLHFRTASPKRFYLGQRFLRRCSWEKMCVIWKHIRPFEYESKSSVPIFTLPCMTTPDDFP